MKRVPQNTDTYRTINKVYKSLKVNQEIKNYKEFCKLLGLSPSSGNSRNGHIRTFNYFFEYERKGHGYIITKIYDKPIEYNRYHKSEYKNERYCYGDINDYLDTKGIYALINKSDIYIGKSFDLYTRLSNHLGEHSSIPYTRDMLINGGMCYVLFDLGIDDDYLLKECESIVINHYIDNTNLNVVNKRKNVNNKKQSLNRYITVSTEDYELAVSILKGNNIEVL